MIFFVYGLIGLFVANKTSPEDILFEANSSVKQESEIKIILGDIERGCGKAGGV